MQRSVGVRDAKAQLSRLLADVQRGREWTITERGKPIARLVPFEQKERSFADRIRRLEEAGIIEAAAPRRLPVPPPLPLAHGSARRVLDADRNALGDF